MENVTAAAVERETLLAVSDMSQLSMYFLARVQWELFP